MNSLRLIMTCLALFVSITTHAQLKPLAGVELFGSNELVMRPNGREFKYQPGDMALIYGLAYEIKKVEFRALAQTLMFMDSPTSYRPTHSEYTVSAAYQLNKFRLKVEHMCLHPIENYQASRVKIFAGHTKLGVYYNL
ncbi:hypothetical protein [uncultured Sunxiuqinia sp.]|uniref:hypothetical protein n=1 Tax=uncultured Sunxiuqinia sp. TaxID=1573825 RepID=UPI002617F8A9|nr:hypothetical protein [uncultured Sunxiuqinia sp.]